MQPVFYAPLAAVQGEEPDGVGFLRIEACEPAGGFFRSFVLFQIKDLTPDDKYLLYAREISITVELYAGPDLAGFYAAMSFIDTLVLRGENR
jgi:hypothetical protein